MGGQALSAPDFVIKGIVEVLFHCVGATLAVVRHYYLYKKRATARVAPTNTARE